MMSTGQKSAEVAKVHTFFNKSKYRHLCKSLVKAEVLIQFLYSSKSEKVQTLKSAKVKSYPLRDIFHQLFLSKANLNLPPHSRLPLLSVSSLSCYLVFVFHCMFLHHFCLTCFILLHLVHFFVLCHFFFLFIFCVTLFLSSFTSFLTHYTCLA